MDISVITLILTSFTALAAVIGPIISSVINVRSNERTKRFELYSPQIYAAVRRFTDAYAQIPRRRDFKSVSEYGRTELVQESLSAYRSFSAAAYEVIAFIPNCEIHEQITELLADLELSRSPTAEDDHKFQKLTAAIAKELSDEFSPKKKRIGRKTKRSSCK